MFSISVLCQQPGRVATGPYLFDEKHLSHALSYEVDSNASSAGFEVTVSWKNRQGYNEFMFSRLNRDRLKEDTIDGICTVDIGKIGLTDDKSVHPKLHLHLTQDDDDEQTFELTRLTVSELTVSSLPINNDGDVVTSDTKC
jgi:hypothetical protein